MKREAIPAYPLRWPDGKPRTSPNRRREGTYKVEFARARDDVARSVDRMAGRWCVISSNVPTRGDGLPYARHREPDDPGVAVWWVDRDNDQRCVPCDTFRRVRDNMRAAGLALEAFRMLDRTGCSGILKAALQGFAALPAPADHWSVLGIVDRNQGTVALSLAVHERHRLLARTHHPDRGGDLETMARINAARDACLREIEA